MTPTETARRSDALYYDRITRRELCDMTANAEADRDYYKKRLDDLKSSNSATCHYDLISNMTVGSVSLDCFGLRCSNCGREQMSFTPPKYCPDCGMRVESGVPHGDEG